jgi:hypothetical protein
MSTYGIRVVRRVAHIIDLNELEWLRSHIVDFYGGANMISNVSL